MYILNIISSENKQFNFTITFIFSILKNKNTGRFNFTKLGEKIFTKGYIIIF